MQKLILGIIAVICLDVGFIAFTGSDHLDETASLSAIESLTETNPETGPINNLTDGTSSSDHSLITDAAPGETIEAGIVKVSPTSSYRPKINRFERPTVAYHRKDSTDASFRMSKKNRQVPASMAVRYPTVVIALRKPSPIKLDKLYVRDMPVERRPNIPDAAQTVSKSNKKSFFGHALRIIKKPYDWTKAIGSKLL